MLSFVLRVLLNAVVLMYILPELSGITFHGEFWPQAMVAGLLFVVVSYVVMWLLKAFTVLTLGIGALYILLFFCISRFRILRPSLFGPCALIPLFLPRKCTVQLVLTCEGARLADICTAPILARCS